MGGLFGKKTRPRDDVKGSRRQVGKGGELNDVDRAKFQLKAASKKVTIYRKRLEKEIETNKKRAKQLLREKRKDRALFFLKINKFKTKRIRNLEGQLLNLETLVDNLRAEEDNAAIFKAMKQGNNQLKAMQKELPVEAVEKLMEDSAGNREYLDEIEGLLGGDLNDVDESEVLKEFEAMQQLEADSVLSTLPHVPGGKEDNTDPATKINLPDVPTDDPAIGVKEKEAETKVEKQRVAVLA